MERFFDGTDQENSKHKEERDRLGNKIKTRRKEWKKEKKRFFFEIFFTYIEVPILMCSPLGWEHPRTTLRKENPPTRMGNSPKTFIHPFHSFFHLKAWENIESAAHDDLKGLLTFRNVEILKECSFRKNQILLRENTESCKLF
jgi:hypothetical protein